MTATDLVGIFFSSWLAWPVWVCAALGIGFTLYEKRLKNK